MLNMWSLSVVALNLRVLSTTIPFSRSEVVQQTVRGTVFPTNAPDTPMPHIDTDFLQFFGHPRAAIAAKAQPRLFLDMRQNDHIRALSATGRAAAYGPQSARADVHHLTQPLGWERPITFFDKPEPHGFLN